MREILRQQSSFHSDIPKMKYEQTTSLNYTSSGRRKKLKYQKDNTQQMICLRVIGFQFLATPTVQNTKAWGWSSATPRTEEEEIAQLRRLNSEKKNWKTKSQLSCD